MKLLVLLAVLAVAYAFWRNGRAEAQARERQQERPPPAAGQPPAGAPQEMVPCALCAVHLPRTEALADARGRLYCSSEHRARGAD